MILSEILIKITRIYIRHFISEERALQQIMAKQLIQLIISGGQVVGKAFSNAVRQEIRMSQQAANARYSGNQSTEAAAETAKMGLTVDEAKEILNVSELKPEDIEKNFEHLFAVNDKAKGGSFYLQSKVGSD